MDYLLLILAGIVQGLTEFLPVSSSAHLILLPVITGREDQGLVYDIAAHLGSLAAVLFYFRQDLRRLLFAWFRSLAGSESTQDARIVWYVLLATLPVVVFGFVFYEVVAGIFRDPVIIAVATIGFGALLWWADHRGKQQLDVQSLTAGKALYIGLAQAIALVPGTSRSGITITAGLLFGFSRTEAARFSFYLSIPTIVMAAAYSFYHVYGTTISPDPAGFFLVFFVSAISAWIAISLFLAFVEKIGMLPFVIYRLLLGGLLLYFYL